MMIEGEPMTVASELYTSIIDWNTKRSAEDLALAHEVWDMTPWVVDVYDGRTQDGRYLEMMHWCRERWGDQAWWPSGRKGSWQRGGATVDGWTWWGFDTENKMSEFVAAWPSPESEKVN